MKPSIGLVFGTVLALLMTVHAAHAGDATVCKLHARDMLTALDAGRFIDATEHFDAAMRQRVTPDQLRDLWASLSAAYGTPDPAAAVEIQHQGNYINAIVPMATGSGVALQVTCRADDAIAGFHIVPLAAAP
ncbi:MAG TPA: hypothetical protein VFG73_11350 [Rhodanobacteraceae bacterium]|nr:hypothetical protein [Rhodanobacteraceae bacterium]